MVTGVNCSGVTSYTQEAPNSNIIWDRIKIIYGNVSETQTYVTQTVTVRFQAEYEYEHAIFDGTKGKLYVNGSAVTWSSDYLRWECKYSFDTAGTRMFKVSGVSDAQHALAVIDDEVGALSISWVGKAPFWTQWAFFMTIGVGAAIGGGIFSTLALWLTFLLL